METSTAVWLGRVGENSEIIVSHFVSFNPRGEDRNAHVYALLENLLACLFHPSLPCLPSFKNPCQVYLPPLYPWDNFIAIFCLSTHSLHSFTSLHSLHHLLSPVNTLFLYSVKKKLCVFSFSKFKYFSLAFPWWPYFSLVWIWTACGSWVSVGCRREDLAPKLFWLASRSRTNLSSSCCKGLQHLS